MECLIAASKALAISSAERAVTSLPVICGALYFGWVDSLKSVQGYSIGASFSLGSGRDSAPTGPGTERGAAYTSQRATRRRGRPARRARAATTKSGLAAG